jgi:membrane-bound lytic murein transglycosylase C
MCWIGALAMPRIACGQSNEDKVWQQYQRFVDNAWREQDQTIEARFDAFEQKQRRHWQHLEAAVEKKWDDFIRSTPRQWVDYDATLDVRTKVDFENGIVNITAVVPRQAGDPKTQGIEKITRQAIRLFSSDNPSGTELLKGQVKNQRGEIITSQSAQHYIEQEVVPAAHVAQQPYRARDGVPRIKVSAKIQLVPDHIRIRAQKYLPAVRRQARRFDIAPQLILAVIHTESCFNPLAKSECGALGLMQLIPRYGAREAYRFIFHQDKVLPPAYLHNPENNIELGSAYLHLLKNNYFREVGDAFKKRCLVVCAYNWGPTAIKKRIMQRYAIEAMSRETLYAMLRNQTPEETGNYLQQVSERMPIYDTFF